MHQANFLDPTVATVRTPIPNPQSPINTRRQAAEQIRRVAGDLQRQVLAFIAGRGPRGATDEELSEALAMKLDTARARRCELRDLHLVVDSGRRRSTASGRAAVVWTAGGISQEMTPASPGAGRRDPSRDAPAPAAGPAPPATPAARARAPVNYPCIDWHEADRPPRRRDVFRPVAPTEARRSDD